MKQNRDISAPKLGMDRDSHINQLKNTSYTFAFNANTEQEQGGSLNITNEPSNYLDVIFPEGYKVIGYRKHRQSERTFYILTNPSTGKSTIGYVNDIPIEYQNDDVEKDCDGCQSKNELGVPLELQNQTPSKVYVELINDECHSVQEGMQLDIDHPVKFLEIKTEKGQVNLYWNDYKNPPRWLNTTDVSYLYVQEVPCDDDVQETCIIVDKLLQFPKYGSFRIDPEKLEIGGNLKLGTYEFYGAYCDLYGNNITDYFTPTNPVPIFDENNNILSQVELDAYTNFGIKLNMEGLDTRYPYYKIVCIERNNVNNTQSAFLEGIHPTTDNTVVYSSSGSIDDDLYISSGNHRIRKRVDLAELTYVKTKYDKAKGSASINGAQYMWGMYKKPELNLQPVVNLFGSLLKWQTSVAKETLYKNAVACSKYKGYMREEVQPFSIRYRFKDGGYTSNFPLVGRPNFPVGNLNAMPVDEKSTVSPTNINRASLEQDVTECIGVSRQEKWQIFNTAQIIDICDAASGVETQTVTDNLTRSCIIEDVDTVPADEILIRVDNDFTNLKDYVDENFDEVTDPSSELYIPELVSYLTGTYPADHCDGDIDFQGASCGALTLQGYQVGIQDVVNEQVDFVEKCIENYIKSLPPSFCNLYERDTATGDFLEDTDFANTYMQCGKIVFERDFNFYNENCSYASTIINNNDPLQQSTSYFHNYYGADTIPELHTTKNATYTSSEFYTKVHKGALFFRIEKNGRDSLMFEVTATAPCPETDDISSSNKMRYTFFSSCSTDAPLPITLQNPNSPTPNPDCDGGYSPPTAGLIDNASEGVLVQLDVSTYPETFYVAIDVPIAQEIGTCGDFQTRFRVAPVCGCFSVYTRDVEYDYVNVAWDSIGIQKTETYSADCVFEVPVVGDCDPIPYAYGEFSYWESIEQYPDNQELYDSSGLLIRDEDLALLSTYDKNNFMDFYTTGVPVEGVYELTGGTDLRCANIRHPRFPSNALIPFMSDTPVAPFSDTLIYPLGVRFDPEVAKTILQVALVNDIITQSDYDNIESYEILRGDNSVSKSVLANGLGYDMYKYQKESNTHYYANFPHNDLGQDLFHYEDETRSQLIQHPYNSERNNRFSFISPDLFLTNPPIPTEVVLSGYQVGNSTGRFVDVEDHPKWVILGKDAKSLAASLAILEVALEIAIQLAEIADDQWYLVLGGLGSTGGGGSTNLFVSWGLAIIYGVSQFLLVGQYRYQWLQIFRDLGTLYNFAGYNVSHGYHNNFIPNTILYDNGNDTDPSLNSYIRGLSIRKYMKNGRYIYRDGSTGEDKMFINNWSREKSVFLSTGDNFLYYEDAYKNYDNNLLSPEQGSKTLLSQNNCKTDLDYTRNVGSPYFTLKNYIPDQYGTIDSIKWLTTNYIFDIDNISATNCGETIFGGTVAISRFTWKRKLSLFTHTAMDLPDKLPFNYGDYNNIGDVRFFCDYESDSIDFILGFVPFPDIDSDFNFDCVTGKNGFYLRPPSKLYLYAYGITDFLVESEINCNFRYGRNNLKDNFYPSIGDMVDWTQEKNVPISEPNTFYYNNSYSLPVSGNPYRILDTSYSDENQLILAKQDNAVIWSEEDNDENSPVDPWLIFKPLNWFEFPAEYGKLIQLKGIEGGQVLARFEDRQLILNAVDNLADRLLPQTRELGTGGVFSTRPKESNVTDLGFAGTQHSDMLSTPYGHYSVDAKRGKVFEQRGSESLEPISDFINGKPSGMKNWFREQLPFKILREYPDLDIDNKFKGIGISMGWDAREDRVFITKKDYRKKTQELCFSDQTFYDTSGIQAIIDQYIGLGYTYEGIVDCQLKFNLIQFSLSEDTDLYVTFDTSSMIDQTGVYAAAALQTWFAGYQAANPGYTGNLYIIPYGYEQFLDIPYRLRHSDGQTFIEHSANFLGTTNAATQVDTVNNRITLQATDIASATPVTDRFGTISTVLNVKYMTTGTPIGGLTSGQVYEVEVISTTQIEFTTANLTSVGTDRHYFIPQKIAAISPTVSGLWPTITIMPPDINTALWVPPDKLMYVSFMDEVHFKYHDNSVGEGFDGNQIEQQPTIPFFNDYQNYLVAMTEYNTINCVVYPIFQHWRGDTGAFGLMLMAALVGHIMTQEEITSYDVVPSYDSVAYYGFFRPDEYFLLLTENPYELAYIPGTSPAEYLQPLMDLNWKARFDKLALTPQDAQDIFTSQEFQDDLQVLIGEETAVILDTIYVTLPVVEITDDEFFDDLSWTIAYKPTEGRWTSYFGFFPEYYVSHNEYFQTGYNWGTNAETLWSHPLNNTSFQVFGGELQPFIVEFPSINQNVEKIYSSMSLNIESKRYQDDWSYSQNMEVGFNKAIIYNNTDNSGLLNLVRQKSYKDVARYPITNSGNSQDILYTSEDEKHIFNYFYNRTKKEVSNVPQWIFDANMIHKTIDPRAVSFRGKKLLERIRGEQALVRLIQDKESRYSITLKDIKIEDIVYE